MICHPELDYNGHVSFVANVFLFQESHLNSASVSTTPAVVVVSARVVSLNIYPLVTFNTDHRPLGAGRGGGGAGMVRDKGYFGNKCRE